MTLGGAQRLAPRNERRSLQSHQTTSHERVEPAPSSILGCVGCQRGGSLKSLLCLEVRVQSRVPQRLEHAVFCKATRHRARREIRSARSAKVRQCAFKISPRSAGSLDSTAAKKRPARDWGQSAWTPLERFISPCVVGEASCRRNPKNFRNSVLEISPQPRLSGGPFLANPIDGQPQRIGHNLTA